MAQLPATTQLSSDLIAFMNIGCFSSRGEIHEANSVIAKLFDCQAHLKLCGSNARDISAEVQKPYKIRSYRSWV